MAWTLERSNLRFERAHEHLPLGVASDSGYWGNEPPRNTGPIQMLVSGLFLAPEHPMPRARNLAWCPLAE
jgi:hypothetical protein